MHALIEFGESGGRGGSRHAAASADAPRSITVASSRIAQCLQSVLLEGVSSPSHWWRFAAAGRRDHGTLPAPGYIRPGTCCVDRSAVRTCGMATPAKLQPGSLPECDPIHAHCRRPREAVGYRGGHLYLSAREKGEPPRRGNRLIRRRCGALGAHGTTPAPRSRRRGLSSPASPILSRCGDHKSGNHSSWW